MHRLKIGWQKFSRDKRGKTVLWQTPNWPLVGWVLFRVLSHFVRADYLKSGFGFLGSALLFTWAYLEITKGASYFRRSLGAIVIILSVLSYFGR